MSVVGHSCKSTCCKCGRCEEFGRPSTCCKCGRSDLSIWWVFMELWCLCVREVGQDYSCGALRCSARGCGVLCTVVSRVVDKCLVPVPIGFLFSPAVIWLPIPGESKDNGRDKGKTKIMMKKYNSKMFFTLPYSPSKRPSLLFPPKTWLLSPML